MFITTDELEQRVLALERMLRPQFILMKDAALKYGRSYRTIKSLVSEYKITKLKPGKVKNNPILENELIQALSRERPLGKVINSQKQKLPSELPFKKRTR